MRRGNVAIVVAIAVSLSLAMIAAAAVMYGGQNDTETPTPTPTSAAAPATPGALYAGGYQDPARTSEKTDAAPAPTRVRIPAIGVDASLEDLGIGADGELVAPVSYDDAGWFADGVAPGDIGPAIIAGHVDSPTGPAVFLRIAELKAGDAIEVERADGSTATFTVTGTAQSAKAEFPTSEVYDSVPRPELRLITCAGAFDRSIGHYTDNLIVFAAETS